MSTAEGSSAATRRGRVKPARGWLPVVFTMLHIPEGSLRDLAEPRPSLVLWLFPSLLHFPGQGALGVHLATVFLSLLRKGPCDSISVTSRRPNVESVGTFHTTAWGEAQLPVSPPLEDKVPQKHTLDSTQGEC